MRTRNVWVRKDMLAGSPARKLCLALPAAKRHHEDERASGGGISDFRRAVDEPAISAFDNYVGQHTKQLLSLVPLSKRRAERMRRGRFHDLDQTAEVLGWFDIELLVGLAEGEVTFLRRMFLRRHVYEHNGGEVDATYLQTSGDKTVRLKQRLSETVEDVHRLLGNLDRMARNLHDGFHELLPPVPGPIEFHQKYLSAMKAAERR